MKPIFSILLQAALLLGLSSAEATADNVMLPPTSPVTQPHLTPHSFQSYGALPGAPGSPPYESTLPLNNPGSALAPLPGNQPSTSTGTTTNP
jgi:hypothetical protein